MNSSQNSKDNEANTQEPTMSDLFNMMKSCKADTDNILGIIAAHTTETNTKIEKITEKVDAVSTVSLQHADKIESLESTVEILKQDQLKNNVCISGIPSSIIENGNVTNLVIQIANTLEVEFNNTHLSAYAIANKFVIASFFNIKHKQLMFAKMRAKRSLMVEEVFTTTSNSQIYLNDHLTPHFNKLFIMARNAKKDGKLTSVSSIGGKIRVRKCENDVPITITLESQLSTLIDMVIDDEHTPANADVAGPSNKPTQQTRSLRSQRQPNSNTDQQKPLVPSYKRKARHTPQVPAKKTK